MTNNRAVLSQLGKLRDDNVNLDRHRVCRQFFLFRLILLVDGDIAARIEYKRRAVAAQTARSRVNWYTHCLGTIDIPGQVVYLSRSQYT